MMNTLRASLFRFWQTLSALWQRATGGSALRQRLYAAGAALLMLLIVTGVVFASMAPAAAPKQQVAVRAQATATETATPPPTVTPTATAKPTPKPTAKPVPKTPPPPPAPPPPPPAPPTPAPSSSGTFVIGDSMFSQFCGTPTPTPAPPTPTATVAAPTATATTAAPTATATGGVGGTTSFTDGHAGLAMPSACVPCPYTAGNNPSQAQIAAALASAANTYGLPVNLLKAVAWQESHWHEDVYSCDGGIGLMQIQYYIYSWLNGVSVPDCKLSATNYDPYTLSGNAGLGAKYLKYLECYYSYWGGYNYDANGNPHSLTNPSKYTVAWYYMQAGLPYPDSSQPNSLCAASFNANAYYPALPSTTSDVWSCPYSATAGDNTLLDMTVSAYNAGPGVTNNGINNGWYVSSVETYIPQFASGALPVPS